MIRGFQRLQPGDAISASEYNRLLDEIERGSRRVVAPPLSLRNGGDGDQLSIEQRPFIWVRITGHETENYSYGTVDQSRYSGIEQTDDPNTAGTYDLPSGIQFFSDSLYLMEVNGRTDVPDNAIVKAYQSNNGPYYTFLFEQAFEYGGGGGSGVALVKILSYNDFTSNTGYIPDLINKPPGILYYIGMIQGFIQGPGPFDTGTLVYLVPYYQIPIVGSLPGLPQLPGAPTAYLALNMGTTATLPVADTSGNPSIVPINNQNTTLQVYVATQYPAATTLDCTGVPPNDKLVIGP
jgi:hypothetical protein